MEDPLVPSEELLVPLSRSRRGARGVAGVALLWSVTACSGSGASTATPTSTPTPTSTQLSDIPGVVHAKGLAREHVARKVDYPTRPPLGGPHWPPQALGVLGWQRCDVYTEPVVDEFAVHALEHGAVWITYQPSVAKAAVDQLVQLRNIRPDYVLLSPYPGQPSPIMVTAWGAQLAATGPSDVRLAQFVRQYAGGAQGGELGADCAHGSTLTEAQGALVRSGG